MLAKTITDGIARKGYQDTSAYRYQDFDGTIKRIRLTRLDTTAALNDKSDNNPFGWEIVNK